MHKPAITKLDADIIVTLEDDQLADAVALIAQWKISQSPKDERDALREMGPGFVIVGSTWMFEAHVMGEGFETYFGNTEGKMVEITAESYGTLGLPEAAGVLLRALGVWQKERGGAGDLDEEYHQLDIDFYQTGVTDKSKKRMAAYIRDHADQFTINITDS